MHFIKRFFAVLAVAICALTPAAHAAQYTYDQRGRLTGVVESDGSSVNYTYDANGNVLSITRSGATLPLAITTFAPASGAVGTPVTIRGTGFSPVPGQNSVSFNGQAATVTASNATTIVATVPVGATSGLISVGVNGNTATSSVAFVITTIEIGGFTPKVGPVNTQVVIDGNGFDVLPANNTVKFNLTQAVVSAATTTQLTVAVPAGATSGRISVVAPSGSATSDDDFLVPPPGYSAGQIAMAGRHDTPTEGLIYTVNSTNKVAVALFDATAGQRLSIVVTNNSMVGIYRVYAPDGTLVMWSNMSQSSYVVDLGPLALAGTYSFVMIPSTRPGSSTVRVVPEYIVALQTNGTALPMSLASGQNASLSFTAVAGESYNFILENFISVPTGHSANVEVLRADGTQLKNCQGLSGGSTNCHFDISESGTYRMRIDPYAQITTTFQARISADFRAVLTSGTPIDLELAVPGRTAMLEFTVAAGQAVTLNFGSINYTTPAQTSSVRIYNSAGTQVEVLNTSTNNITGNMPALPAGTYRAWFAPGNAATATFRAQLEAVTPATLLANGVSSSFSAAVPSQTIYYTFSGTAGQNLGLGLTNVSFASGSPGYVWVQVLRPDGGQLTTANCSTTPGRCAIPLRNLPATGTYRIELVTSAVERGNVTVTLSQSVTGTLTQGTPLPVTLTIPGQNAVLTYNHAVTQTVALTVGSISLTPPGAPVAVRLFNASGSQLGYASSSTNASIPLPNLAAGTYYVQIEATTAATGSMQAVISQGTPVPVDSSPVTFAATSAGEKAYFTFAGTAGQRIGIGLTNLGLSPASPTHVSVAVYKPDNSQLLFGYCYVTNTGCQHSLRDLPVTGTYRIEVTPGAATQAMNFNLRLVPVSVTSITPSATAIPVNFASPGQFAEYSFAATAGQIATLRLAGSALSPANSELALRVYNPSGTQVGYVSVTTTPGTVNLTNLVAGTYRVTIVPTFAATGSAEFTFAPPLTGTLVANGVTANYSTAVAGQVGYFTFAGTAGQNLGLGVTGLAQTPASPTHVTWRVYKPDGSQLLSGYCYTTSTGCQATLRSLPVAGNYRLELEPGSLQSSASYSLTLSQSNGGALTPGNTPVTSSFGVPGQNAIYTFNAAAGQIVTLRIDSMAMTPANGEVVLRLFNPSGSQVNAMTVTSNPATLNLTGLVAGTYGISIVPTYAATGSVQFTLAPGLTGTLVSNGSASAFASAVAGQNTYLTFSANAGDYLGLGITGLALTPSSPNNITVQLYRPDNSNIAGVFCYTSNSGCQLSLRNAPATGTYRIEVLPGAQQTTSFNATLSQPVTGTLAAATPLPVTLSSPGQIAVVTFTATAGQSVPLTLSAPAMSPAGSQVTMTVLGPSGNQIDSASATTNPITRNLNNLAAGTHTILLAPTYAATGSLQLSRP